MPRFVNVSMKSEIFTTHSKRNFLLPLLNGDPYKIPNAKIPNGTKS